MVLGSVAMAFAVDYSDVAAEDKYAEAIGTLSNLGVLNGYEDGTFKADKEIKRSEFAKVVVEALGLTTSAASTAPFSDVAAGKWYTPYVALAAELNVVNGYGDGTFRPDQTITDTQAIVMVVRALGYTDEYFGGYNAAKYISQATALGLMKDVKAGTGASVRGNVAQLVFNALDVRRVNIDKDGTAVQITPVDTMKTRLAGSPYTPAGGKAGDAFLYDGTQALAAGANMTAYLGKYITATADSNNNIKGVSTVVSKTLAGKVSADGKFTADGTTYTFYPTTEFTTGAALFENGAVNGKSNVNAQSGSALSLEVEVSGTVVTKVYSISKWTPAVTFQAAKDSLKVDELKLGTYSFAPDKVGKLDETKFALVGLDKIADLAEGNVVTVYTQGAVIIKLEVGTKTVAGAANEQKANGDFVINGTTYAVDASAASAPTLGTSGTAYLAYNGKIFAFKADEEAAVADNYAVLLKRENGNNGISTSNARVQLFTAEGKTVVLSGSNKVTTVAGTALNWDATCAGITLGTPVTYKLNADGQVTSLLPVAGAATAGKVAANGVLSPAGAKLVASTVIIAKNANGYSVLKAADLTGKSLTYSGIVKSKDNTSVVFLMVDAQAAAAGATGNYIVFNGASTKVVGKDVVTAITALKDGATVSYTADPTDVATSAAVATSSAQLLNATVNASGVLTTAPAVAGTNYSVTTKTALTNGFIVENGVNVAGHQVADNAIVYVWKTNAWTVGSLSDLATANGADFKLYDTSSTPDGIFDVVLVVAK